jgi:hypothetical protein
MNAHLTRDQPSFYHLTGKTNNDRPVAEATVATPADHGVYPMKISQIAIRFLHRGRIIFYPMESSLFVYCLSAWGSHTPLGTVRQSGLVFGKSIDLDERIEHGIQSD